MAHKTARMMVRDRACSTGSKIIFDIAVGVRFQAVAWELHRFEPVPDFRINEVNYSLGLCHVSERARRSKFAASFIGAK